MDDICKQLTTIVTLSQGVVLGPDEGRRIEVKGDMTWKFTPTLTLPHQGGGDRGVRLHGVRWIAAQRRISRDMIEV
jgi:hypothetical protein